MLFSPLMQYRVYINGEGGNFLEEHDDFFPASPELVIPDEMIDAELDFRHINKIHPDMVIS